MGHDVEKRKGKLLFSVFATGIGALCHPIQHNKNKISKVESQQHI
jgi:prophage DNA circulation protein